MRMKTMLFFVLSALLVCAVNLQAQAPTSKVIRIENLPTTVAPGTVGQGFTFQLFDASTAGTPLYCESQTLDVDANSAISFNFGAGAAVTPPCPSTPPGLNPIDFVVGQSRYLDAVDPTTGVSFLTERKALTAAAFALNPGPQGPQGIQGPPGQQGPPGVVQTVTAGNASITVGGTAADRLVSIAANGVTNANVANGALSPAKITGTAATLGSNTFTGNQDISGSMFVGNPNGVGVDAVSGIVGVRGSTGVGGFAIVGSAPANGIAGQFNGAVRVEGPLSVGGAGTVGVDAPGVVGGRLQILPNGNIGVGSPNPLNKLEVTTNSAAAIDGTGSVGVRGNANMNGGFGIVGNANAPGSLAGQFNGNVNVAGNVRTRVLEIVGGADLAERFEVSAPRSASAKTPKVRIDSGMVVSIDPQNPGTLAISSTAYDHRVAGVISGAAGVNPGMLMGQSDSVADGDQPVALVGRVYCWADASNGAIEPGDLLTTSSTPGHAMKVTDGKKAQGAIIGKAMTGLKEGKGLVLVLITLQ